MNAAEIIPALIAVGLWAGIAAHVSAIAVRAMRSHTSSTTKGTR